MLICPGPSLPIVIALNFCSVSERKFAKMLITSIWLKKCVRKGNIFVQEERNNITPLPKITGKMKVVSYGLVLTGVTEQMEAVR